MDHEQPENKLKWLDWVRRYGVTVLLLLVAFNQLYLTTFGNLSRWKGGGFGMYTEFHPTYYRVYTKFKTSPPPGTNFTPSPFMGIMRKKIRINPTEKNLRKLKREMRKGSGIQDLVIQVWKPKFDPKTMKFYRELYREY